jgi:hypothetical protein
VNKKQENDPMPPYIPVDRVAERLNVTAEKLWEFQGFGWIWIVEKKGTPCVPEHHEYKAKFILHLQQVLKLNPIQISRVLLAEKPPYSLNDYDVDRILAEARASKSDEKVACAHEEAD